jgi:hypothetical protein
MSWIQMSEAVRRLARTGRRTEPNIRAFLSNLFRNGLVRWRGSPRGVELHRGDLARVHLEHRRVSREFGETMCAVRAGMSASARELASLTAHVPSPSPSPVSPPPLEEPSAASMAPPTLGAIKRFLQQPEIRELTRGDQEQAARQHFEPRPLRRSLWRKAIEAVGKRSSGRRPAK